MYAVYFLGKDIPRGHPKATLLSGQSPPVVYIIHISTRIPLSIAERGCVLFLSIGLYKIIHNKKNTNINLLYICKSTIYHKGIKINYASTLVIRIIMYI